LKKIEERYKKYHQEWKKRRSGCHDIIDMVSESMDMNRKEFMKLVGIETDEDNGVILPPNPK